MTFRVALTFDAEHPDRPHRVGATEAVLDLLDAEGITSTFFLQGRWAEAYPTVARSVAERGHLIGNHSFYHARMPLLTDAGLAADIRAAERAILAATGVDPRPWFRCPFGAGSGDLRVRAGLERLGYREVHWDVEGFDWRPSTKGPAMGRRMTREAVARGDGAVLLLHPWTTATGRGLGALISGLRAEGADFVRLDALA
ncbi:MAG TPA: polysaccharide deacetylase family protein [Candidatus Limnocylindrales bacterium]